jgi:hypothetical protein
MESMPALAAGSEQESNHIKQIQIENKNIDPKYLHFLKSIDFEVLQSLNWALWSIVDVHYNKVANLNRQ